MNERLTLSQQHLYTFEECPRRFYLRYLARVPWPEAPLAPDQELAYERGRRLHRWIERQFLGLPATDATSMDPVMRVWWTTFQSHKPALPTGQQFVETTLTVPIGPGGRHFLAGRFDLLIVGEDPNDKPTAAIYDWKTGEPRDISRLRRAWQTRVYLAIVAGGGAALVPHRPAAFAPDRVSFTYWYVEDPDRPRVIAYNQATHERNMGELEALVSAIDHQLTTGEWPLTDNWSRCRQCAYTAICGRQAAGFAPLDTAEDEDLEPGEDWLEPQWG